MDGWIDGSPEKAARSVPGQRVEESSVVLPFV